MKILMQTLWEAKVAWDEEVPAHIYQEWATWRRQLSLLNTFPIRRYYFVPRTTVNTVELHGFSNAFEQAYAAVVYLRAMYNDHHTSCLCDSSDKQVQGGSHQARVYPSSGAVRSTPRKHCSSSIKHLVGQDARLDRQHCGA